MGALDTAKEIVRIGSTAGLSKDVVDLLEKKAALLTDELLLAHRKIEGLKAENAELRTRLQSEKPVGFVENMGVLWKRAATGFESNPYCKHCTGNPIMSPIRGAKKWVCATGNHIAPYSVTPPPV